MPPSTSCRDRNDCLTNLIVSMCCTFGVRPLMERRRQLGRLHAVEPQYQTRGAHDRFILQVQADSQAQTPELFIAARSADSACTRPTAAAHKRSNFLSRVP